MSEQKPHLEEGPQGLALVDGDQVLRADFTRMLGRLRPENLGKEMLVRAARVRGEDGRLVSIRISDYAWMEKEIDWSLTGTTEEEAGRINTVREFPAGVGRKRQETL